MNLKKLLLSLVIVAIFGVFITVQGVTYAKTLPAGDEVYMGVRELMENNTPAMGYGINQPGQANGAYIWNIVRYDSSTSTTYHNDNIYCVKAGVGFTEAGTSSSETLKRRPYNVNYDMKTEREAIRTHKDKTGAQNTVLQGLVEGNITVGGTTINRYNAILAVLDNLYLPGKSTANEKKELIYNIFKTIIEDDDYSDYRGSILELATSKVWGTDVYELIENPTKYNLSDSYALTDNDINAVQQAVLWYFTNYGESSNKYDKTNGEKDWIHYSLNGVDYSNKLSEYNSSNQIGEVRNYQAEVLYNYMIKQAKANAKDYADSSLKAGTPVKVDTTTLNGEISGDYYIMGPIHMTQANSTPYTIDFKVKNNGAEISNYKLLDENKKEVATGKTVKDLIGKNFYIRVPKTEVVSLTVDITVNYNDSTMTLWTSSESNGEQPLVEVDKKPASETIELKFEPEKPEKEFDLALRKYITKVERDGKEISIATRVPNIDEDSLTSGTTATYKHKKDPVMVTTGDTVTYKMTIYNEAEKQGRATKVVDQLPTGLKFSKVISGNFEKESYDETTNTLLLVRKAGNETNLPAYTKGSLTSGTGAETIEIECTVTATPDTKSNKVLTNVAWISEEIDEDGTTIIKQEGLDRDSQPGTFPDVNKDNMSNYKGNDSNKTDLADSNYYYKGKQDDDDFEKLVLLPEAFDLKLIKRITAVNDQSVPERIEKIDVSKLNTSGTDSKTTADYQLNKEPVGVAKGDIVTYTFRIYNEGMLDGYAQEITEDIPEGLQFIWSEKTGEELKNDTTLTDEEKNAIEFNQKYLWGKFVYDDKKENIIQQTQKKIATQT